MGLRISDFVGTALVPAAVLAYDPVGWSGFAPAKWLVVSCLGLVTVAAVALRRRNVVDQRLAAIGTAFLLWLTLASALGLEGQYAWLGTPERHSGWAMWMLCAALFIFPPSFISLTNGAVLASIGLTAALGQQRGDRLTGTFGSAAYLAAACTLLLPIVIYSALNAQRSAAWRLAATIGSLGLISSLIGSGTRGAWAAMVGISIAVVARGWRPPKWWLLAASTVAIATMLLGGSLHRIGSTFDTNQAGGSSRVDEWRVAIKTLSHHPLVGVGPEGYRLAFREGVDANYERKHGRDVQPDRAHNSLLDMAIVAGLPGLALYLAVLVLVSSAIWRRIAAVNASIVDASMIGAAAVGLAAYQAQQLFLFPLAELDPVAWAIAGAILYGPTTHVAAHANHDWPRRALAAGAALLAAFAGWWGIRDTLADRAAWRALQAYDRRDPVTTQANLDDALRYRDDEVRLQLLAVNISPDLDVVSAALSRARELSPLDPIVIRRLADEALRSRRSPAQIVATLRQFVVDDPNNAYLQQRLGTAAAIAGQFDLAELSWQAAQALAPRNPSPPAFLASLYAQQQRNAEARAAAERALGLLPTDPALVADLILLLDKVGR